STISTQLNWGASYLVNDVYRRFWAAGRSERHYVAAGRVATLVMMLIPGIVTLNISTVEGAWQFLLAIGAGTGLVYLLRWHRRPRARAARQGRARRHRRGDAHVVPRQRHAPRGPDANRRGIVRR